MPSLFNIIVILCGHGTVLAFNFKEKIQKVELSWLDWSILKGKNVSINIIYFLILLFNWFDYKSKYDLIKSSLKCFKFE